MSPTDPVAAFWWRRHRMDFFIALDKQGPSHRIASIKAAASRWCALITAEEALDLVDYYSQEVK